MITIYHNPRCRKSREGLEYLKSKCSDFKVVEYLKTPLDRATLKDLLMKLNKPAKELIRTQEDIFKEKFKGKNFTEEEWITILLEYPALLQRPIVVKGFKAVLGQPVEALAALID